MAHKRNNIQSKTNLSMKKYSRENTEATHKISSSTLSMAKSNPTESLDDETKLAKRHLTKEMWQLVSIAVKRMADELVSISNNQQGPTRVINTEPQSSFSPNTHQTILVEASNAHQPSSASLIVHKPMAINSGAGDLPYTKENTVVVKEPIKKRALPTQILESSLQMKKRGISNNAARHTIKSKVQNKSLPKKNGKGTISRSHNNHKLK